VTAAEIVAALDGIRPTYVSETDLHAELADALSAAGHDVRREVRLSDGASRIDMLVDRVGIEVKVDGTWKAVAWQLLRYAKCDEIDELVLVTTRASHRVTYSHVVHKPVHVVVVTGGSL
jgi:hypothetical protein